MDPHSRSKKRLKPSPPPSPSLSSPPPPMLTKDDLLPLLAPLSHSQLASIVASSALELGPALAALRALCSGLPARKLFVRGLGWDTAHDALRSAFSPFGPVEEAVVIYDKQTGKSKGYGFVTFKYVDGAIAALKNPSKKIDNRITVTQLASEGGNNTVGSGKEQKAGNADVAGRKIFVGNVPSDMPSDRLLSEFSTFGEIQEGPLGIDKQTGKFKGFALFVYKKAESAQAALANPNKLLDGHWLVCKPGGDGKKGRTGTGTGMGNGVTELGNETGNSNNGLSFPSQYTGTGLPGYTGAGTVIPPLPGGFNLPNNNNNNTNSNNNNGVGMGNLGQYPGFAGLNFGNLGNSVPGLFRMGQGTGLPDPVTYPFRGPDSQPGLGQAGFGQPGQAGFGQHGQPGLGQPGFGQASFGQAGFGQPGLGQAGLGQAGRMAGGPGFYGNVPPHYY